MTDLTNLPQLSLLMNILFQYLRCAPDTDAKVVWDMMINQWHLEPPQLIISVTGGAQRFDLKRRMQETFKRGLMNAATSTCKSCPNVPKQCMSFTKDVF